MGKWMLKKSQFEVKDLKEHAFLTQKKGNSVTKLTQFTLIPSIRWRN